MPGISIGSVSVSVVPAARDFTSTLRAQLLPGADALGKEIGSRIADGIKSALHDISVSVSIADTGADARIRDLTVRLDALGAKDVNPAVGLDDTRIVERLDVISLKLDKIGARDVTPKLDLDDSSFNAKMDAAAAKLKGMSGGPAWLAPALLATPAAATIGGAGLGAAAGLAGAFTAAAGAAGAFGAVAKPVLTDAKTAAAAVEAAQNAHAVAVAKVTAQYQYAMSVATTRAQQQAAYAAEQKGFSNAEIAQNAAVAKAYADLSPAQIALSRQLGDMANAWDGVKAAETLVVAGALEPWLHAVTGLTKDLAPIIAKVAPVIHDLGVKFGDLINSPEFKAFRDFIANTGSQALGALGGTLIDFLKAGAELLVKFNPLIEKTVGWIGGLGPAVLKWSESQKTADDITKFMAWFAANGPAVGGFLKSVGEALKALVPGLAAGGIAELKILTDFFNWVAKLPKGISGPIAEVAGALLLMNKLGVFSVGVKFVGLAAGWITKLLGGVGVEIGAAGMQTAGDTMAGAAVAMQKAADTMAGAGAAAGAAGKAAPAAEGAAAGAAGAGGISLGAFAGLAAGGALIGGGFILAVKNAIESGWKGILGILPGLFGGVGGILNVSAAGWTSTILDHFATPVHQMWADLGHFLASSFDVTRQQVAHTADNLAGYITESWDKTYAQVTGTAGRLVSFLAAAWDRALADARTGWNAVSSFITGSWNKIYSQVTTAAGHLIAFLAGSWNKAETDAKTTWNAIASWFTSWWHSLTSAFTSAANTLESFLSGAWNKIAGTAKTILTGITSWVTGTFAGAMRSAFSGVVNGIASVWNTLQAIVTKPVDFIINKVYDKGIVPVVNAVGKLIGLHLEPLPGLAAGGKVTAGTTGTADDVLARVSKGETVVSAAHSQQLAPIFAAAGVPGYAAGGVPGGGVAGDIGHAVGSAVSGVGGVLSDIGKALAGLAGDALGAAAKTILDPLLAAMPGGGTPLGADLKKIPQTIVDDLIAKLKGTAAGGGGGGGAPGPVTAGVARWASDILAVLKMLGLPASYLGLVEAQMTSESGGNEAAINLTDINAQEGHPSKGLMQVIQGTFDRYRSPSLSSNIYDPMANIYAALNYAAHGAGFGTGPGQVGSMHGYDNGGWMPPGLSLNMNGTGRPEPVLSGAQWDLITSAAHGGDGAAMGGRAMAKKFDRMIHLLEQAPGRTAGGVAGALDGTASAAVRGAYFRTR